MLTSTNVFVTQASDSAMRIVIDLQAAQAQSRFRGIGRYALSLAQGIARHRGEHEVIVLLNGQFAASVEPIRAAFAGLLPASGVLVWQGLPDVRQL